MFDVARFGARLPGLIRRMGQLAAKLRPQLIYVNGPRLMPAVAMARLGCATVFHSHNRIAGAAERVLVRAAIAASGASVIAASEYTAAQWSSARVLYSGVDGPKQAPPRTHNGLCVGMIGRISPQKRQKEFVLACARLSVTRPDLRFLLCGDVLFGDRRGLRYKRELQPLVPSSLRLMKWTENVYEPLAELDLLVVPSSHEGGFPRVAMEAFAAGVPVLAQASGAITEVIVEGRNGFLLPSGSAEEIAARVGELVDHREARQRVARAARHLWQETFASTRYRREMCQLLRELAGHS
jgi:glycosyltransferase involved in cell wall biosynthesis